MTGTDNAVGITTTGLPINDTSTGTFSAVDLTTKGDALVHNGTNYTRLPVGTDGQVLMADSGEATGLVWGALSFTGDLIPISNQSASSSASIEFTDLDFSTYGSLWFNMRGIHPATDNVSFRILVSVDNGSSYLATGYSWVYHQYLALDGSDNESHSSFSSFIQACDTVGSGTNEGCGGWLWLLPSDAPGTQTNQALEWQMHSVDISAGLRGHWGGAMNTTSSTIDAIKFQFSSGNIVEGDFYLYGFNAS